MGKVQTQFSGIGTRIRKARVERGMTQEQLASPRFTKGYISALERGSVRPSLKALGFIADQLEVPLSYLVMAAQEGASERDPELEIIQVELNYTYDYAELLIRQGTGNSIKEALNMLQAAEWAYNDLIDSGFDSKYLCSNVSGVA